MAIDTTANKQGPASSAAQPTPAPTKPAPSLAELRSTSWGREAYGSNGATQRSSIDPGQQVRIRDGNLAQKSDAVLDRVRASGLKSDALVTDQIRTIGAKNVPDAHGALDPTAPGRVGVGKVPAALGATSGESENPAPGGRGSASWPPKK